MSHPEHLDEGLLHALLDGEVPSAELPPIQDHLARCPACRARLEEARGLLGESDRMIAAIELPAIPTAGPAALPRRRTAWLAWAATVVGAAGLGYAVRGLAPAPGIAPDAPASVLAVDSMTTSPPPPPLPPPAPAGEPAARSNRPPQAAVGRTAAPSPEPASQDRAGLRDRAERREVAASPPADSARADARVGNLAAASPAAAPPRQQGSLQALRSRESVASGFAASEAAKTVATEPAPEPIDFADAVRRLGGTLRLVDGLVPLRLEARGPYVRVIYALGRDELVLEQRRVEGTVEFTLRGPATLPADSLARMRARVRD
jgi:hypothetical protein